jgi:hypothetical protein
MSVTLCHSGFCHVWGGGGNGAGGSGCNVLPYILQHFLSGRVSENRFCSRLLSIPLVINNLENKYKHMFNWAGDPRLVN